MVSIPSHAENSESSLVPPFNLLNGSEFTKILDDILVRLRSPSSPGTRNPGHQLDPY